jgi:hypothetical protein
MRTFAPALTFLLLLAACTPAPPPKPAPAQQAAAARAPAAPGEAATAALARDLEIDRILRTAPVYRRGGAFGLVLVDGMKPIAPPPEAAVAWAGLAERLRGRFGALRPVTPLAADLAAGDPSETDAMRLRRAGAVQRLDYLIVYRLRETQVKTGWFSAAKTSATAEAAILDVRSGAVLGGITAPPTQALPDPAAARQAAVTALGAALDDLGRRLDADAMRAAAPVN